MGSEEKPHRDWVFIVVAVVFVGIIVGAAVYVFVLPLIGFEKLVLRSYYWVATPEGRVSQLILDVASNGTFDITVEEMLIDGAKVNSSGYGGRFGNEAGSTLTTKFYVAPANMTFLLGHTYNATAVTSRGNRFSFATEVKQDNVKTESITLTHLALYEWPLGGIRYAGVDIKVLSGTDTIIKRVWINGTECSINPLWIPVNDNQDSVFTTYGWTYYSNYTATVETVAGTRSNITATALP